MDIPRLIDEYVPGVAAVIDDVVEGFENSVRQPVLPHQLAGGRRTRQLTGKGRNHPGRRGSFFSIAVATVFFNESRMVDDRICSCYRRTYACCQEATGCPVDQWER